MRYDERIPSIPGAVLDTASRLPDQTALIDRSMRWTYAELEAEMVRSVRACIALGIEPGDRVGLCAPNTAEWIFAALGIMGAGGTVVPLNTRFKGQELAYILGKAKAKALFAGDFLGANYVDLVRASGVDLPTLEHTVGWDAEEHGLAGGWTAFLESGEAVSEETARASIARLKGSDVSDIMFTSGTTGAPKGAVLTHSQAIRIYGWLAETFTFRPGDTFLVIPPFFHSFGFKAGWVASFIHGVTVIPQRIFQVDEVIETIARERVSIICGPPVIFYEIINHPRRAELDLSSLRVLVPSAASVPVSLIHLLRDELKAEVVLNAYGLTEASAVVTSCRVGDEPEEIAATVGRPAEGVEVRVVDDGGRELAANEVGEVLVRGFNVMQGYFEAPEETAAAIDADGWLHTGDLGTFTEAGNLRITDRKKDIYIVGGFNAYPAEIENMLMRMDGVDQVAVIGVPDGRMGEIGAAYVVPSPESPVSAESIREWARANMANFKVPRYVELVSELPRNASGKVLKIELRHRFAAAHPAVA